MCACTCIGSSESRQDNFAAYRALACPAARLASAATMSLIVLGLPLLTASPCPDGWTASPNASWANRCFFIPAERVMSLWGCVALCRAEGGVPACPASAEENWFAAQMVGANVDWQDWAWLG